ncbi:hypothetical protein UNDYM_5933 (plasmid) [Undibacterium sp. YM2]|uniref:hypothetical protein n=1 Tax=Undibacterium sp. YM2 TaxID=2058625 RepID=UPI001331D3F4|nr:hypothetical protein [Undibacterium sp. YM2]BBB70186.1 hypothetical protein UNDYM_5933 [Undibacterium sp. YM2]
MLRTTLIARLDTGMQAQPGSMALSAGRCEGTLIQLSPKTAIEGEGTLVGKGIAFNDASLLFALQAKKAGAKWSGEATISAKLTAKSDIEWPAAKSSSVIVPVPADPKPVSGRIAVQLDNSATATHTATWELNDHPVAMTLVASILKPGSTATWLTVAVVSHALERNGTALAWSGVEAVAIGRTGGLIPRPAANAEADSSTFAARYMANKAGGGDAGNDPGMRYRGLGASATVLEGALGAKLRNAVWTAQTADAIMIGGGFLGILRINRDEAAPLLRLPILAGLGKTLGQCSEVSQTIEVAWNDSAAARLVAHTRATVASPSNSSYGALTAALANGKLADARLVTAALVEQSFDTRATNVVYPLATTPFFVAAAVSVHQLFESMDVPFQHPEALSLVSGAFRTDGGGVSMAAAITMRNSPPQSSEEPQLVKVSQPARLWVLGDALSDSEWRGPQESGESLAPLLRKHAMRRDVAPRAYMLSQSDGTASAGLVGALALDQFLAASPGQNVFADASRGAAALPASNGILAWLSPPQEGRSEPIRDVNDKAPWVRSGLAGLTRSMHLPAHAGSVVELASKATTPRLVWVSQTQVPLYLPLQTLPLAGPPIGWLNDASPLVRLPADVDVAGALATIHGSAATGRSVQPFLPALASTTSVGERAGILTLRRARLLTRLDADAAAGIFAFDPTNTRFGAPAQAGSSFARKLRTPRPGPLPQNADLLERASSDRRIQASAVHRLQAFAAWRSTADIVQGTSAPFDVKEVVAWSVTVVASPGTNGVVSERWNGALKVECHIEILTVNAVDLFPIKPLEVFARLLLENIDGAMKTRASLHVGDLDIPMRWFKVSEVDAEFKTIKTIPLKPFNHGAKVTVILDPRQNQHEDPVLPLDALVQALRQPGPLPAIELQWTVHPEPGTPPVLEISKWLRLDVPVEGQESLASGWRRAPLTLRTPLYAVTQERGAMPLTQATLIFSDPSYNRDLAGPPVTEAARLALLQPAPRQSARGECVFSLSADRGKVQRLGVVTFMADLRYERPMEDIAQAFAESEKVSSGGDIKPKEKFDLKTYTSELCAKLEDRNGKQRNLHIFSKEIVELNLAKVYELPLAALREADGSPARFSAGDMLCLKVSLKKEREVELWNDEYRKFDQVRLDWKGEEAPSHTLRINMTDEPVVEPPPALYATLLRTAGDNEKTWRIAVPQHAQSPLPRRIDLVDPARGFRLGLMQRHADFVWYMSRPATDLGPSSLYVIKSDRNGQLYLPESQEEFLAPATGLPI